VLKTRSVVTEFGGANFANIYWRNFADAIHWLQRHIGTYQQSSTGNLSTDFFL